MPIINYAERATRYEKKFFENPKVSEKNKKAVRRFLDQYTVSPATKARFFSHIIYILERLPDLETQMHDRELVNQTFRYFRENLTDSYNDTIINVSLAFVRWLNDKELPKGFKDVRRPSKKNQRRDLEPEDMWTWEETKNCIKFTDSVQMQALITVQVDGGFRPSEFVDLNYGDVKFFGEVVVFAVKKGKTGKRDVPCQRCVPYFRTWYESHPTKEKNDPLWVMEHADKSHKEGKSTNEIRRYDYWAMKKRLEFIANKAGIKKNCDFYTLRHSSCTLDKLDNLPVELAAKRHGHTVEYFTEIYARLSQKDVADRMRKHFAGNTEKVCENCNHINNVHLEICERCKTPLSVKKALELQKEESTRVQEQMKMLTAQMDKFRETTIAEAVAEIKQKLAQKQK